MLPHFSHYYGAFLDDRLTKELTLFHRYIVIVRAELVPFPPPILNYLKLPAKNNDNTLEGIIMTSVKMIINKTEQQPGPAFRGEGFGKRLGAANLAERNRLGHEAKILREAERLRELTPERFKALPEKEQAERRREIERLAGELKTYQRKNPVVSQAPHFQAALQNVEFLRQITAPNESRLSFPADNNALIINFLPIHTGRIHSITLDPDKGGQADKQQLPKTDHTASPERTIIISAILSDNLAIHGNSELGPTYQLTEQFKAENGTIKNKRIKDEQERSADEFINRIIKSLEFSKQELLKQADKEGRSA